MTVCDRSQNGHFFVKMCIRDSPFYIRFHRHAEGCCRFPSKCDGSVSYTHLDVYKRQTYGSNSNNAYFTGLGLYKEEYGTSFAYDDKGNVVKVTDQAKKNSSFEYDTADNLKKLMDPKGNAFKYDYDKKHRVTGAASAARCV